MFGYIYKTTNNINGKIYIGKKHSSSFIKGYYGSGKLINRAIDKYGIENFSVEIIEECETLEELNLKEKYYIKHLESNYKLGKGYNIASGGDGGNIISLLPEIDYNSFILDCKRRAKGKNNPNYGNGYKISGNNNPSKRPEVREKLSKATSGKNNPMYGKKGKLSHRYGTKHSEETKNKIKESLKNKVYKKICKNCNREFDTKYARTTYCSADCKRKYRDNHNK
ncbi:homing endonuclease [Staphylococcus phage PG-2021_5]